MFVCMCLFEVHSPAVVCEFIIGSKYPDSTLLIILKLKSILIFDCTFGKLLYKACESNNKIVHMFVFVAKLDPVSRSWRGSVGNPPDDRLLRLEERAVRVVRPTVRRIRSFKEFVASPELRILGRAGSLLPPRQRGESRSGDLIWVFFVKQKQLFYDLIRGFISAIICLINPFLIRLTGFNATVFFCARIVYFIARFSMVKSWL